MRILAAAGVIVLLGSSVFAQQPANPQAPTDRVSFMSALLADLAARHPSVGAVRSIGLFGVVELVRNRSTLEPMAPFNGTSPEMAALGKFFRDEGLFTFLRWNYFFTNPPLCITESQLRDAFAILDRGLSITDQAVVST